MLIASLSSTVGYWLQLLSTTCYCLQLFTTTQFEFSAHHLFYLFIGPVKPFSQPLRLEPLGRTRPAELGPGRVEGGARDMMLLLILLLIPRPGRQRRLKAGRGRRPRRRRGRRQKNQQIRFPRPTERSKRRRNPDKNLDCPEAAKLAFQQLERP